MEIYFIYLHVNILPVVINVCIVNLGLQHYVRFSQIRSHTWPDLQKPNTTVHFTNPSLSWTTLVVHSRDIEDCGGAPRRKSTLKPANFPYITIWQHWLGNTKPKKTLRLILNPFKKLLQNFKNFLFNGIFYWLTN